MRGSGVFVSGNGDWAGKPRGGKVRTARLATGEIHADGGIPPNTPDLISGGAFVVYSGEVDEVLNEGPVTTYGPNDMVLDNWGSVGRWIARGADHLTGAERHRFRPVRRPRHAANRGADRDVRHRRARLQRLRGQLREASFTSITTHADAGVGIQVSRHVDRIRVDGDVKTSGGSARAWSRATSCRCRHTRSVSSRAVRSVSCPSAAP